MERAVNGWPRKTARAAKRDVAQVGDGGAEDQQNRQEQQQNDDGDGRRVFDVVALGGLGDGRDLDVDALGDPAPVHHAAKIATGMETAMP